MTPRRFLPALLLLFVGSGCAALIYEVVWFQLLQLVIGSSAVSMGVLLGTFMGGMCLGSYLLPRYIGRGEHPLRVYASLELAIGVLGLLILFGMPLLNSLYAAISPGSGVSGIVLRGLAAAVCLLPPTLLMGATLPAISRWVESTPEGVSWLGFFYGGNIAGGVVGSLLAGFYLLRVYDLGVATYAAIALNVTVAILALLIARVTPVAEVLPSDHSAQSPMPTSGQWAIYVAIALSGMTALSCEVIWTRLLSLLFGGTVYTFSLILAVFLFGLGIGSSLGSAIGRAASQPRVVFGWCQMLLCAAMAWAAYMLTQSMPYWPVNPSITTDPWFNFQLDFVRCLWAVLPGAILWGASFPLALASLARRDQDPGRLVGGVYAANTVGAIVGSLVASLLLVVWLGSQHAQQVVILLSALSGLLVLSTGAADDSAAGRSAVGATLTIVLAAAAAGLLSRTVHPLPGIFAAYGRYTATRLGQAEVIYMGEGWNATVAVTRLPGGVLNYHNAGKVQASSEPQDMRLQRMLGHMTTLVPAHAAKVLVIGCGAGVTAGAVSIDPVVVDQTIAEIEPLVPVVVAREFGEHNFHVVDNKKVHIRIDDARHFLLTTNERFDAITSDPLDPWVKGAAMLYTREFFELVKKRLNPGGAVTLFVQLYESNTEAVKSEIATFMEAFPHGVVWGNTNNGAGYDLVLLGQVEDTKIDVDAIQAKLQRPEYAPVAQSLREIGMNSAVDLFSTFAGRASDLQPWLADASINRDRNLRLQFLAGLGLNLYQSDTIYAGMLAYARRFPDELFVASPQTMNALRAGILREQGR
ncbi:MAG TPA: fused MFS/spermidine synthase [Vicinamibacterales bacterium]|jgi:spermidine synthase|nr:fused MFS/spermidine synthase [Vicinamibacterales bacterium]